MRLWRCYRPARVSAPQPQTTHVQLAPPELIREPAGLEPLYRALEANPGAAVAIDTEADSFHHYFEKVCLLQIGLGDEVFLVDPLAGLDLGPVLEHLARRPLLLHGADYDLRLLHRAYGLRARELFDTMIAAQLLGEREIGLAALLSRRVGVSLDKAHQKADWSERPLSADRRVYAAADVAYLAELVASLRTDLEAKGRLEWHAEECARLSVTDFTPRGDDPENDWRLKGTNALSPLERSVVRALWHAREERAQQLDRPPFRVLTNERLLAAARAAAEGQSDLATLFPGRPLPPAFERSIRDALVKARSAPTSEWPGPRRGGKEEVDPALQPVIERLKTKRDRRAKELGLDPGVVASKGHLTAAARVLLRDRQAGPEKVAGESGISRWRAGLLVDGEPGRRVPPSPPPGSLA